MPSSRFYAIYCARSDGAKAENSPTADQLSKDLKTDIKTGTQCYDYYRELTENDAKHIDWRLKLGAMWASIRGDADMKKSPTDYILAAFPQNYRLYEHIKTRPENSKSAKSRTHAGGGHDRQDAYLYGHPQGRKKRYRSPAEFIHHLIYLTDDNAVEPMDCACKFCAPDEIQLKKPKSTSAIPLSGSVKDSKVQSPAIQLATANAGASLIPNAAAPNRTTVPSIPSTSPISTHPSQVSAAHQPTLQQPEILQPQPTQSQNPVWLNHDTAIFLKSQRPDLYDMYQNILMNRYQGEGNNRALQIITNELDHLISLGYQIPGYHSREGGAQTSQASAMSLPTTGIGAHMNLGGQAQSQHNIYGFGDQHNLNYDPINYGFSQGVGMPTAMAGQPHTNATQANIVDDLINYGGEEPDNHGGST